MIYFHVRKEPVEPRFNKTQPSYGWAGTSTVWAENGFHDEDGMGVEPPENADEIIDAHLGKIGKTREVVFAPQDFETQGWYGAYGKRGREWSTHIKGLTLAEAIRCYSWFARLAEDNRSGERTRPTKARIVNSLTGEVIDPPELAPAELISGTRVKTIPCTREELDRVLWDCSYVRKVPRRSGGFAYTSGGDFVFAYEMSDGSLRVRPSMWKPAPE